MLCCAAFVCQRFGLHCNLLRHVTEALFICLNFQVVCYLLNTKVAVTLSYPYSLVTSEYMLAFEHTHTYYSLDDQITASKSCVPQYDNVGFAYIVAMFAHVTSSLTS